MIKGRRVYGSLEEAKDLRAGAPRRSCVKDGKKIGPKPLATLRKHKQSKAVREVISWRCRIFWMGALPQRFKNPFYADRI